MMSRAIARSLMSLVPSDTKGTATIILNTYYGTRETVTVDGCWLKQSRGGMESHGMLEVEADATIVKVPDHLLNPNGEGREIRESDVITIFDVAYTVARAGGNLKSVRTVWDCYCQKMAAYTFTGSNSLDFSQSANSQFMPSIIL